MRPIALVPALLTIVAVAHAQPRTPARPMPAPTAPAPAAPVPATPQQTTATFGDWVLRCNRVGPAPGTPFCEVVQTLQHDGKPVAEMAIGRPARGQPMQFTLLVPVNVSFGAAAVLTGPREGEAGTDLTWRRCLPGGCLAETRLSDEAQGRMRAWTEPGRIGFTDGLGRAAALPVSPRGLPQALDAMAKGSDS